MFTFWFVISCRYVQFVNVLYDGVVVFLSSCLEVLFYGNYGLDVYHGCVVCLDVMIGLSVCFYVFLCGCLFISMNFRSFKTYVHARNNACNLYNVLFWYVGRCAYWYDGVLYYYLMTVSL